MDSPAEAAGVSKGAFYKFYAFRKLPFFDVLEGMHAEVYETAASVLAKRPFPPPADRTAGALLTACRVMEHFGMIERDAAYLLRRGIIKKATVTAAWFPCGSC